MRIPEATPEVWKGQSFGAEMRRVGPDWSKQPKIGVNSIRERESDSHQHLNRCDQNWNPGFI